MGDTVPHVATVRYRSRGAHRRKGSGPASPAHSSTTLRDRLRASRIGRVPCFAAELRSVVRGEATAARTDVETLV
jgi:hypothetical protein